MLLDQEINSRMTYIKYSTLFVYLHFQAKDRTKERNKKKKYAYL